MRLTIRSGTLALDVDITVVDPAVTIGEVFSAITGRAPGPTVYVDDWPYRSSDAVGAVPVRNGSLVADVAPVAAEQAGELAKVAGSGAGTVIPMGEGTFDIGRGRQTVERPAFRLRIDRYETRFRRLTREPVTVDGEPLDPGEERAGQLIVVDAEAFLARVGNRTRAAVLPVDESGRLPYRRTPRDVSLVSQPPPAKPEPPERVRAAPPFSWIVALTPIPIGIVVALLFSPFFLAFMLMSPVLAGGRWYEGRRRERRDRAAFTRAVERTVDAYVAAMAAWRRQEARIRRHRCPDLVELADRAHHGRAGLWERRAEHDDFLQVTVGLGDVAFDSPPSPLPEIEAAAESAAWLRSVPITVDLAAEPGIGIVGGEEERRQAAAALATELALAHGPADVVLVLLADPAAAGWWDWAKWLPHLEDDRGFLQVATDPAAAAALLGSLSRPPADRQGRGGPTSHPLASPTPIVLVDGHRFLDGSFRALSRIVRAGGARAVVVADRTADLPALCTTLVELDGSGWASVRSLTTGASHRRVAPVLVGAGTAAAIGRDLAARCDPDRANEAADLPATCTLRSLLGGDIDTASMLDRWHRHRQGPTGTLGVAAAGPVRLQLVADGPHALIAGTTGSGKSELLRTLVATLAVEHGPDQLTFVLVDFKGGGAFDACADLPHTVGVVTDLDEHLAARALRCLRAELRYREQRLRAAGVSDLRDYDPGDDPLPRLVVVVDEFATLVAELPDFMASLVDVAQRGRSLGIHLVLATQRPAGVVDAKIRANTNIRISLRVQDDADSQDVIGDRRAADVDRRLPGRAWVRLGASELIQFQTAIVSQPSTTAEPLPLRVAPFGLRAGWDERAAAGGSGLGGPTDLQLLVSSASAAATSLGLDSPRVPWPAPLPDRVDVGKLAASPGSGRRWSAPIGLIDRPDEQRVDTFWWTPEVGNLLCYGADSSSTSQLLTTLAAGLGDAHLYVLDFTGGGALTPLAERANVGAVASPRHEELVMRVLDRLEAEQELRAERARSAGAGRLGPDSGLPMVMLLVANYGGFTAHIEESQQFELGARIERLVRDGAQLGMFVVLSANHERGVPSRLAGQIQSRLVMRMADPTSYTAFGLRTRDIPELGRGRAIDVASGAEVQIAQAAAVAPGPGQEPRCPGRAGGPPPLRCLANDVAPEGLVDRSRELKGGLSLVIGRRHRDLEPATFGLRAGTNLIVSGPPGSGKTTALRALAAAALAADPAGQTILIGPQEEWPGGVEQLGADLIDAERRSLVLIDGLAAIDDAGAQAIDRAAAGSTWIVVADRPEVLAAPPHWLRRITASRTGLLLQPAFDHGEVLRCRLPLRSSSPGSFPPGRGFLVEAGSVELVQVVNAGRSTVPHRPGPGDGVGAAGAASGRGVRLR